MLRCSSPESSLPPPCGSTKLRTPSDLSSTADAPLSAGSNRGSRCSPHGRVPLEWPRYWASIAAAARVGELNVFATGGWSASWADCLVGGREIFTILSFEFLPSSVPKGFAPGNPEPYPQKRQQNNCLGSGIVISSCHQSV